METQRRLRLRELGKGDWDLLIKRIRNGECTPFLGAGACAGVLPLASEIAQEWADEYDYPLTDSTNLIKVAQYLAVEYNDWLFPKMLIKERFEKVVPNFKLPSEIHGVLAELPLPLYITTNYDDFMYQALTLNEKKEPVQELCRWNAKVENLKSRLDDSSFCPSAEQPVVFHLHGHTNTVPSMVLTEDDYLDFLINTGKDMNTGQNKVLLPSWIESAFTRSSLLFLGYSLSDANFRVVFRSLVTYMQKNFGMAHVSVQLTPGGLSDDQLERALKYLDTYFRELKVKVYWGTCEEFAKDLRERMGL